MSAFKHKKCSHLSVSQFGNFCKEKKENQKEHVDKIQTDKHQHEMSIVKKDNKTDIVYEVSHLKRTYHRQSSSKLQLKVYSHCALVPLWIKLKHLQRWSEIAV